MSNVLCCVCLQVLGEGGLVRAPAETAGTGACCGGGKFQGEVGWDKGIGSHEAEDQSGLCTGDNFHFRTGKGPFVPTPGKLGQSNICLQLAGVPVGSGLSARRGCGGSRAEGTGAGAAPRAGAGLSGRGGAAGPGGLGLGGGARVLIGQRCQPAV
ncbi:uncharacterized protein LOC127463897 [Manacus candei]|uniref:uncharacterized protein LOC127463897 n=1 Tax=Manacus candei TaxID=415023 RepID=UPI002227CB31|nr:uncharacterized protein LOC127463897 [Manacus candei]